MPPAVACYCKKALLERCVSIGDLGEWTRGLPGPPLYGEEEGGTEPRFFLLEVPGVLGKSESRNSV